MSLYSTVFWSINGHGHRSVIGYFIKYLNHRVLIKNWCQEHWWDKLNELTDSLFVTDFHLLSCIFTAEHCVLFCDTDPQNCLLPALKSMTYQKIFDCTHYKWLISLFLIIIIFFLHCGYFIWQLNYSSNAPLLKGTEGALITPVCVIIRLWLSYLVFMHRLTGRAEIVLKFFYSSISAQTPVKSWNVVPF